MRLITLFLATTSAAGDEVDKLPLANFVPNFKHYSGYFNVSRGEHSLHYWFFESQNNADDPLVLWLQGGPGCSAMDAALRENGPFRVSTDGATIEQNHYAWNKTADDLVDALTEFVKLYPKFKARKFFVTGESYAGVFIPLLAQKLVKSGFNDLHLQAIAVGNGAFNEDDNANAMLLYFYGHGFVSKEYVLDVSQACCGHERVLDCNFNREAADNETCSNYMKEVQSKIYDFYLDPYNAYYSCYTTDGANTTVKEKSCSETQGSTIYLNRADVQEALGVNKPWEMCNNTVIEGYNQTHPDMSEIVLFLLKSKVHVLFYTGDFDMMCNILGTEMFVDGLQLEEIHSHKIWSCGGQTAGFWSSFQEGTTFLDLFSVRGASHFVPNDKPREALQLIGHLLSGDRDYSKAVAIPADGPPVTGCSAMPQLQMLLIPVVLILLK